MVHQCDVVVLSKLNYMAFIGMQCNEHFKSLLLSIIEFAGTRAIYVQIKQALLLIKRSQHDTSSIKGSFLVEDELLSEVVTFLRRLFAYYV